MKCSNCGAELGANDVFCQNCGASVENSNVQGNVQGVGASTNQFSNYGPLNNQPNYGMQGNVQQNNVNNAQQPNYGFTPAPKKNNTMTYVAVVALLIAIVLAVVVVVKVVIPSTKGEEKGQDSGNSTIETPNNKEEESTYKVKYGGFKFSVPESVETDTSDSDCLYIGNMDDEWAAAVVIAQGSYNSLRRNKSNMKSTVYQYISQYSYDIDFEVSDPEVKTVGDVEFLILDIEVEGEVESYVYAELNSTYVAAIDLIIGDNSKDEVLKIIAKVIDSAEYQGASSYIQEDNLKLEDVNKALENLFKDEQTSQTNQVNQTNQTVE